MPAKISITQDESKVSNKKHDGNKTYICNLNSNSIKRVRYIRGRKILELLLNNITVCWA